MQHLAPASAAVLVAVIAASVMGYAIQRGATCTVAAVDEILDKRKATRLLAMVEASLWVTGALALARVAGAAPTMPAAYPVSLWTFVGGVLLGLGAWVNGACVFGAVARLGCGEWRYLATPLGFYAGCLSADAFDAPAARELGGTSPVLAAAGWLAVPFLAFVAWRVVPALRFPQSGAAKRARQLAGRVWTPHAATSVIGITFAVILLVVGVWAYTDVLAQLARGSTMRLALGALCLLALYAGALLGGWTAGRWSNARPTVGGVARCFAGGASMAAGGLLIPGSNDGLILVGMPLLRPYAWVAFATMCAAIATAMLVARRVAVGGRVEPLR